MSNITKKLKLQKEIDKNRTHDKFNKLANFLSGNLGTRKSKIINTIKSQTPKGREVEGRFTKRFLKPAIDGYFKGFPVEVIFEGVNSQGETQWKNKFFGSKPAPDFIFKPRQPSLFDNAHSPFPLDTVGEVKYDKLTFRNFVTGLGQIIAYLESSRIEKEPKQYGYYIYFNTDIDKDTIISNHEETFLRTLWKQQNIFAVII